MPSVSAYPNLVTSAVGGNSYSWSFPEAAQYDPSVVQSNDAAVVEMHYNDSLGFAGSSQPLQGQQFGFSIPNGATIQGIEVKVRSWTDADGVGKIQNLTLIKNNTAGLDTVNAKYYYFGQQTLTTTHSVYSGGGSSDLWGTTWTPADINGSQFGFAVVMGEADPESGANGFIYVDYLQMVITYVLNAVKKATIAAFFISG